MKILFVSGIYPKGQDEYYTKFLKKGSLSNASNVFQWGIINGLKENNADFSVLSFPFLPTFPCGYKKSKIDNGDIKYQDIVIGKVCSYSTIAGIKELSIIKKLKKEIYKWSATLSPEDNGLILVYSTYGPFLRSAIDVSKRYNNIQVCPIITDLFISSLSKLKSFPLLKKIQGVFEYKMIKYGLNNANSFILLAKGMEEFVPQSFGKNIVIEGIAGGNYLEPIGKVETAEKKILYTGSLGKHTSVKELVDAFMLTKSTNIKLLICGSGYYEDYIKEKSIDDNRINYLGIVSHSKSIELQKESTALINPRLPSVPDTPYSFPSKTIEYLTSGTPMIGYKLKGIPDEYYKHFYSPEDDSVEELAKLIEKVLSKPQEELDNFAYQAWSFVVENKRAKNQVKKIIEFEEGLIES